MFFDKTLFNKCLDDIESNYRDYLECTIDLQHYDFENDPDDLVGTCKVLDAIKLLRKIDYDYYNDEQDYILKKNY